MTVASLPPVSERLELTEAARLVSKHRETVAKWMRTGVGGVKLYSFKLGRKLHTTKAALDQFLTATQTI